MQQQTTLPPRPVRPAQPDRYRHLVREVNRAHSRLARSVRDQSLTADLDLRDAVAADRRLTAWFETAEGMEYKRAAQEYNAAVIAYRKARAAQIQAAINEQHRQQVRAGMCEKCWTLHRPEVECE